MSFEADTAVTERGGAIFAEVARAWEIWGPNGGYLSAIALRAAGLRAPAGPTGQHFGAVSGPRCVRRGATGGRDVARGARGLLLPSHHVAGRPANAPAQVWTTDKPVGVGPAYRDARMPSVPPPDELKLASDHLGDAPPHPFWQHFDAHPVRWSWPGDPDPRGHVYEQWMRFKNHSPGADPFVDQGRALLLIDTLLWPTHWRGEPTVADYVAPSLDVSVWFHEPSGGADWLLVEARTPVAGAGLINGSARVWTGDGALVASGGSNLLHMPMKPGA